MRFNMLVPIMLTGVLAASNAAAQARVDTNVIYGMYSGLALLMDVHHPTQPNGYGIIFVSGSGWQAPLGYGAVGLKEDGDSDDTVPFEQSVDMETALSRVNVAVKLVRVSGGEHGPNLGVANKPHPELPAIFAETVAWLDRHLKASAPASR